MPRRKNLLENISKQAKAYLFAQLNGFKNFCVTLIILVNISQSEPGSNGNEKVHNFHQRSRAIASPLDGFVSYPGYSLAAITLCLDAVGVFYSPIDCPDMFFVDIVDYMKGVNYSIFSQPLANCISNNLICLNTLKNCFSKK